MGDRLVPHRRLRDLAVRTRGREQADRGVGSFLGNVLWVILAGWWLAIGHIVSGILLCVTIIGIPMGIADFKMVPISLMPLGKEIVSTRRGSFDRTL